MKKSDKLSIKILVKNQSFPENLQNPIIRGFLKDSVAGENVA